MSACRPIMGLHVGQPDLRHFVCILAFRSFVYRASFAARFSYCVPGLSHIRE